MSVTVVSRVRTVMATIGVWCAVGVMTLATCERSSNPPVATLQATVGLVEAQPAGSPDWHSAGPGGQLQIDDALRTGARSSARLSLPGGGGIRMNENSRLRFRRVVFV